MAAAVEALASLQPGPDLAVALSALDRTRLNGHQLVQVIEARAQQLAHQQAELYADIADLAHCPPGVRLSPPDRVTDPSDTTSDELRLALRWTRRAAERQVDIALTLRHRLPAVWRSLLLGTIDSRRAGVIVDGTAELGEALARRVADSVLEGAEAATTGQLRSRLARLVAEADPDGAIDRRQAGLQVRRIVGRPNPDGTGDLIGSDLPGERVAAIMRRLTETARTINDGRTVDQIRADIFLDLLEGRTSAPADSKAVVDIRVDLETLVGSSNSPGHIPGWGPVLADIARQIALEHQDGQWRFTVTDPDTGTILANGTTRRRPTAHQRRTTEAATPECIFPGCRMPARGGDIDHVVARQVGGSTIVVNLAALCRHDHVLKHSPGWNLESHPSGAKTWTTPHGHAYSVGGPSP